MFPSDTPSDTGYAGVSGEDSGQPLPVPAPVVPEVEGTDTGPAELVGPDPQTGSEEVPGEVEPVVVEPVEPQAVEPAEPVVEEPVVGPVEPQAVEPAGPVVEEPVVGPVEPQAVEPAEPVVEEPVVGPVEPQPVVGPVEPQPVAVEPVAVEPVEPVADQPEAGEPLEAVAVVDEAPVIEAVDPPADPVAVDEEFLSAVAEEFDAIEAALVRLDDGSFDSCQVCGDRIGQDRLMADPLITSCPAHT